MNVFASCCFVIILGLSCLESPAQALTIERGVSQKLAAYRKSILSNVNYRLFFKIPSEKAKPIAATETISFDLKENNSPLELDFKAEKNHVLKTRVNGKIINCRFLNEHIIIESKYLNTGRNTVYLEFIAGDLSLNRNNEYLYTLLVPDRARTVFPCFDQPNLKAKFLLTLSVPKEWQALSNASASSIEEEEDHKIYRFNESDIFSTYLFSFVAGKFEVVEKQIGNYKMKFYYRETDSNKIKLSVDTVFALHKKALDFLKDYTGIEFPFEKLDFVALPDFQYGGMEHVGAIDYRASSLFLDSSATKDQQNARANVIGHETAHMWYGDLVTMQWFNDVWMKEVFANFMADKMMQETEIDNSYELKFLLTHFPRAYSVDRTSGANPIRQNLLNLNQAGSLYGAIIYDKAPVMMRQLERLMGADAFREGLSEYLKKFSYKNATWPDLIDILDKRTPENLQVWNKVWVNTPGRPVIDYNLKHENGAIEKLVITQKGEHQTNYILPQFFKIAFVYENHIQEFSINMNRAVMELNEVKGKKLPLYILFNSSGEAYGIFPVDPNMIRLIDENDNAVMRASAYINLYENMLQGRGIKPKELMNLCLSALSEEKEELIQSILANQLTDIYWHYILPEERERLSQEAALSVWTMMNKETVQGKKKILFRTFQSLALDHASLDTLYRIWKEQKPPEGLYLSEDDYTSLAVNLTIKKNADETMLNTQLNRITNKDRKERLQFLMPALSKDEKTRDAFFNSLNNLSVRKKEAWVADALAYLHHPLRTGYSKKYLKQSLDMLEEIQRTNDIFFPATWLSLTLGSYGTKEAADVVRMFLKTHPAYNPQLKLKIVQAADPLFRAEKLLHVQ